MQSFLEELRTQRWDDHRYYHHSRINQSLQFLSACSFIVAYIMLFEDPVISALIGWGVASALLKTPMSSGLATGIVICACMPTTVSTNVVLTKSAGGNEAVSLINAVVGNIIGVAALGLPWGDCIISHDAPVPECRPHSSPNP